MKKTQLIRLEFDKIVNTYSIKTELYSVNVWNYLTETFNIKDGQYGAYIQIVNGQKKSNISK